MIEIKNKKNCSGCEACLNICPVKCIKMEEDEDGVRYPVVNKEKCVKCGQCEKVCPILNNYQSDNKGYLAYGAYNKNKKILKKSSSGGIFYELAKKIITEKNGVVFGVKFDKDENAIFTYAEILEDLIPMLGSKYVQAKVNNSYKEVKKFLSNDRIVLFSGTPCQIAGLKSYLKKDYDNLYTCDIICEGVPSDKMLNIFKKHYEEKYNSKVVDIKFRHKKYGWKYLGFLLTFENGKKLYIPRTEVNYYNGFIRQAFNRPSCYECKFRELNSGSDFKIADFWGVNESRNTKYNFYGVSHLLINTKKGELLFKGLEEKFNLYKSSVDEVKKLNNTFNTHKYSMSEYEELKKKIENKSYEDIYEILNSYNGLTRKQQLIFRIKLKLVKFKYLLKK